jgi:phosphate transport system substrate-binding protein
MRTLTKLLGLVAIPATLTAQADLTGAGATFPYPIYSKWFADYAAKTNVKINYQSIGSGGGIRQLSDGTVDFGASDSPMADGELQKAKGGRVLHFPTVIGAVAVVYNVPGVTTSLKLDGNLLADIFLGKVRKWNDGKIAKLNPGVTLPARDILVVHRSDGSGTTYIFTDFLSSVKWRGRLDLVARATTASPVRSSRCRAQSDTWSLPTRARTSSRSRPSRTRRARSSRRQSSPRLPLPTAWRRS